MAVDLSHQAIPAAKHPETPSDLAPPVRHRWSPRAFLDKPVTPETLRTLLEAARWSASSSNEQPWRFIVARREEPEEFARLLSVLVERNQLWAKSAPVLLLTVAKRTFTTSGKPNRFHLHDTGAATAAIAIQAASMGLQIHGMGGFSADKARETFAIPEDFEPGAAIALGYPGPAESLPADFQAGETAKRARKPFAEIVFAKKWGTPAEL